jgi:succinate-semialdehyde dehydrogenase/glutarate-semialdehyde dehydrogenase
VLAHLADVIDQRAEQLARLLVQEMGKRISEARSEVDITAKIARYYAKNAATFLAPRKLDSSRGDAWIEYHPIGVIVAVEPWNFPYYQLVRVARAQHCDRQSRAGEARQHRPASSARI